MLPLEMLVLALLLHARLILLFRATITSPAMVMFFWQLFITKLTLLLCLKTSLHFSLQLLLLRRLLLLMLLLLSLTSFWVLELLFFLTRFASLSVLEFRVFFVLGSSRGGLAFWLCSLIRLL